MKASILTLRDVKFVRLSVDIDFDVEVKASEFDFDGARLGWSIEHGRNNGNANSWWVAFGFAVTNDDSDIKCPYLIDVQAIGHIDISEAAKEEEREKIIYENGAALVYGAIREMILTTTGRFIPGALMLPTPTFVGAFAEYQERQKAPQSKKTKAKRTPRIQI